MMKKPCDSHLVFLFFKFNSLAAQNETKLKGLSVTSSDLLLMLHPVMKNGTIHLLELSILLKLLHSSIY